jgi:hypothetical protein
MAKFMDVPSGCIVEQLREAHEKALADEADEADEAEQTRPRWTSRRQGRLLRWTGLSKVTVRRTTSTPGDPPPRCTRSRSPRLTSANEALKTNVRNTREPCLLPPELIRADAIDRRREAERGSRRRAALAASQAPRTDAASAPEPCAHW